MTTTAHARFALLLLAALGAAASAFFLVRSDGPPVPDAPALADAGMQPGAAGAEAEHGPLDSLGGAPAHTRVPVPTGKAVDEPHVAATGRLVDAAGAPVAGQEVELQVGVERPPGDPRVRVLSPDVTKYKPRDRATTAADGTFLLHLPLGVFARIVLLGDEIVFRQGPLDLEPRLVDAPLGDLVVQRACAIAGIAGDLRGAPCRGVTVLCGVESRTFDESRAQQVETADDGRFRFAGLPNGSYRVLCRSPRFATQSRTFDLQPEQRLLDVVFALDAGQTIAGRVVDDAGTPVADADVRATAQGSGSSTRARSGADGGFVVGGLTGASYNLSASGKGYRSDKGAQTTANAGAIDVTLRLPRAAAIRGKVVDAAGAPVGGSRVRAVPVSQTLEQDRQQRIFNPGQATKADGTFALNDLGGGDYRVIASGMHLDAQVAPVHAEAGKPVVDLLVAVQRGGAVRVRVESPAGIPVAGARVRVAEQSVPDTTQPMVLMGGNLGDVYPDDFNLGARIARATTDAAGMALVAGLDAGTYRMQVAADVGVQEQPSLVTVPDNEEVATTVRLAPGGFVQFEVTDARGVRLPKKRIEIEGPLGTDKLRSTGGDTGSDGTVRLGPFVPGRYAASLGMPMSTDAFGGAVLLGSGGGPALSGTRVEFAVQAGETTNVTLQRPDLATLRGQLRDDRGAIANGNVRLGGAGQDRSASMRFGMDGSTRTTRTRPDGTFAIADLEPGTYQVRYGKPQQELLAETKVTLAAGDGNAPLELRLQCGTLRVTARGADNQEPLAGAQARLRRADDSKGPGEQSIGDYAFPQALTSETTADAQGVAEFRDVPFGRYGVELTAPRFRPGKSGTVIVDSPNADAGVVQLLPAGRISGTFVEAGGGEPGQAYVEYRSGNATDFKTSNPGRGKFEIDGLEPGDYVLRARRLGQFRFGSRMAAAGPETMVHVEAGVAATVSLQLPPQ